MSLDPIATPDRATRRHLLTTQLRHELQLRYVGSLGGIYWALLNPVIQVGVYVILVTVIFRARIPGAGSRVEYAIFLLSAMAAWLSMQEGLVMSSTALVRHADIVRNVVFPLELLPGSAVIASLISMGVSLTALVVLMVAEGHAVGWSIVCLPLLLTLQIGLTLGLGLLFSIVTAFLRDFTFILPILLQLLTLLTPIVYSIDNMPPALRTITRGNPLFYLLGGYRAVLFGHAWPDWLGLLYVAVVAASLLGIGLAVFRAAKGYVEAFV